MNFVCDFLNVIIVPRIPTPLWSVERSIKTLLK